MRLPIAKMLRHPDKALSFLSYKIKKTLFWGTYVKAIREPKVDGPLKLGPHDYAGIIDKLKANAFDVRPYTIDIADYRAYLVKANYKAYPAYLAGGADPHFHEKSLEHYIAAKMLDLTSRDVYIDVGNYESPTSEIYRKLFECTTYRQDILFPRGVRGDMIGGDAGDMPVEDQFATKMALHCAFEHFEGDSDIRFIRETSRVLRPGGCVCIVPLYLAPKYVIDTDPVISAKGNIRFEEEAILHCVKDYRNRHGRYYDVPHLIGRIRDNLNNQKLTIHAVQNETEIHSACYVKFVCVIEKM